MLGGAAIVGVNTWRNKRLSSRRLVVYVANVATPAALVDRDDRSALTTTRVVDSMARAFHRDEVDRVAAIEYGEVRQHATGVRPRVAPMPSPCQSRASDEDSESDGPEVYPDEAQLVHRHSGPSSIAVMISSRPLLWPLPIKSPRHAALPRLAGAVARRPSPPQRAVIGAPGSTVFATWPIRNHCV
jgi:hypothetical protein